LEDKYLKKLEEYNTKITFLEKYLQKYYLKKEKLLSILERKIRNENTSTKDNIEDFMLAFNKITKKENPMLHENYKNLEKNILENYKEDFLYWYKTENDNTDETFLDFGILENPVEEIFNKKDLCITIPTNNYLELKLNKGYTIKNNDIKIFPQIIDFDENANLNIKKIKYFGLVITTSEIINFIEHNSNLNLKESKDLYLHIRYALNE